MHVCMYSSQILRANAGACYSLTYVVIFCSFRNGVRVHWHHCWPPFFLLKHIKTLIPGSISESLFQRKFHSVNPFYGHGNCCEPGRARFAEEKIEFPSQVVSKTCSILFSAEFGPFSNPFRGRARWMCLYLFLTSWCNWSASGLVVLQTKNQKSYTQASNNHWGDRKCTFIMHFFRIFGLFVFVC